MTPDERYTLLLALAIAAVLILVIGGGMLISEHL